MTLFYSSSSSYIITMRSKDNIIMIPLLCFIFKVYFPWLVIFCKNSELLSSPPTRQPHIYHAVMPDSEDLICLRCIFALFVCRTKFDCCSKTEVNRKWSPMLASLFFKTFFAIWFLLVFFLFSISWSNQEGNMMTK